MQVWTEFGDYLLGRYVLGVLGGVDGAALGDADWHIVLDYEHEVRRDMVRRMLTGTPLDQALRAAWADPVVKDRFLVTPLQRRTLSKRAAPQGGGDVKKVKTESKVEQSGPTKTDDEGAGSRSTGEPGAVRPGTEGPRVW